MNKKCTIPYFYNYLYGFELSHNFFFLDEILRIRFVLFEHRRDEYDNRRWRLTSKWKVVIKLIAQVFFFFTLFLSFPLFGLRKKSEKMNCSLNYDDIS